MISWTWIAISIPSFCASSNTRCQEENEEHTASNGLSTSSPIPPQCESTANNIVIKKTISTVRTTHSGNSKSVTFSIKKTNTLPKPAETARAIRPVQTLRRIPRNIPTSPAISENYVKNIITNAGSSNQNICNGDASVKIQNSQMKPVKLLNHFNKLKSRTFSAPIKSDEDIWLTYLYVLEGWIK